MDRGIWATWYDLPEEGKGEYLSWFHEKHLPKMLARPGYLWAAHVENLWDEAWKKDLALKRERDGWIHTNDPAVPTGNRYLILYGAASPHVFFNPSPAELEAQWTPEERRMFTRRIGSRSCIFVEAARVDGPEVATRAPGLTPGPAIQLGSFNSHKLENEEEICTWYAQSRFPTMGRMTGCVGARRLVSVCGWAKHGILYEFVSMEAMEKYYDGHGDWVPEGKQWTAKEWRARVIRNYIHAPGSASRGRRIWPPAGVVR